MMKRRFKEEQIGRTANEMESGRIAHEAGRKIDLSTVAARGESSCSRIP